MTSLVAVDIGNSSIKLGWFPAGESIRELPPSRVITLDEEQFQSPSWDDFCRLVDSQAHWVIASVNQQVCQRLTMTIAADCPAAEVTVLNNSMLPFESDVLAVDLVGTDRLLAAFAVSSLAPAARPAIVIDSGTAVTVDVVNQQGGFAGGVIMPGAALIARALNDGTAQLPEIVPAKENTPKPIGKDTDDAISAGIYWGLVGSINEVVKQQRRILGESTPVFISGGNDWISKHLDFECHTVSYLCLLGIAAAVEAGLQL
ncbi:MAG: hypothetical protein CMJ76_00460 [Planctomycetaceae bacterium]|nr:hypothetical protein [Planctomycetaceae bacterium]|tara:strand:+ start:431 stop:1207 length:777 start_codon:yes stop_codon:yes gene_type:complete